MDGPSGYPSEGEAVTADYLLRRRLRFEYQPPIRGRNPDFLVHEPSVGDVVLEVYEPALVLPGSVGSFDSIKSLAGGFKERKRKQARAANDAGLPFVLTVGSANSDIAFDTHAAVGVMLGRPGVRIPLDGAAPVQRAETVLLGPGSTRSDLNTSVSALALVNRFNPTLWRLEAAWKQAGLGTDKVTDREVHESIGVRRRIEEILIDRDLFRPDLTRPRLRIFHNPFAARPLDRRFAGVHDEQWGTIAIDHGRVGYGPVASGRFAWELRREGRAPVVDYAVTPARNARRPFNAALVRPG